MAVESTRAGSGTQRTPDGRWLLVGGRRWRASDPAGPQALRQQLVDELMDARRAVKEASGGDAATALARARVHDAKVALGGRGEPWWEASSKDAFERRIAATFRALLHGRAATSTTCPSEVARAVVGRGWRGHMDDVRAVAARLHDAGVLEVRQRGLRVDDPAAATGPLRIGRGASFEARPDELRGTPRRRGAGAPRA